MTDYTIDLQKLQELQLQWSDIQAQSILTKERLNALSLRKAQIIHSAHLLSPRPSLSFTGRVFGIERQLVRYYLNRFKKKEVVVATL